MKRYVWLNIQTGEFSNSWSEEEQKQLSKEDIDERYNTHYKLIEYKCLTDNDFEFCSLMSTR